MIVWLNGAFVPETEARIETTDRGLTLADGVFDTMLAMDGQPVDAPLHFERLARHAAMLGIAIPMAVEDLHRLAETLLRENRFVQDRYAIRTTLTRGPGARGLAPPEPATPTLLMRAAPAPMPEQKPLRLVIAAVTRRNEHSPLARVKALAYGDNLLALLEARERNADDAVLLNTAGHVACATTSNIFIRESGRLITPNLSDGALDGITRQKLLDSGEAVEDTISVGRLRAATEILLTNSITGARTGTIVETSRKN